MPDPDLLIRTSGEMRISNYLLWQIAYTEIFVTERLWPDFRGIHLLEAIADFQRRERRYGGLGEGCGEVEEELLRPHPDSDRLVSGVSGAAVAVAVHGWRRGKVAALAAWEFLGLAEQGGASPPRIAVLVALVSAVCRRLPVARPHVRHLRNLSLACWSTAPS
jgi:hypothetical protein